MNGAQYLAGVDNGKSGVTPIKPYDNNQNFGRLSLQNSIYLPGKTTVQLKVYDRQKVIFRESNTYNLTIDTSQGCLAPLAVTL